MAVPAPVTLLPQNESCPILLSSTNVTLRLQYFNSSAPLRVTCNNRDTPLDCEYYVPYSYFMCRVGNQPCEPPRFGLVDYQGNCCSMDGNPCSSNPNEVSSFINAGYVLLILFCIMLLLGGLFFGYYVFRKRLRADTKPKMTLLIQPVEERV